jgi:hypothetical protein
LIIRDNNFFPVGPDIIKAFEFDLLDIDTAVKPKEKTFAQGYYVGEVQSLTALDFTEALVPDDFIRRYLNSNNNENGN